MTADQCFHCGFLKLPRLCSEKSQIGVKNPELIKKMKKWGNTTGLEQQFYIYILQFYYY